MDFARRRQRQPALGSINLGFIAAIICLRIFERDARRGEGSSLGGRSGGRKKEKNRQKGESNRQQTIYRALNYFISNRTTFDLANGKARMYRILLDTKIDKRNEWGQWGFDLKWLSRDRRGNKKRIQVCAIVNWPHCNYSYRGNNRSFLISLVINSRRSKAWIPS